MKIVKTISGYAALILGVLLLRWFVVAPVSVQGTSMLPNLVDHQILLLKKYDKSYDRFDIIVFDYNGDNLVKRIIGLPGETIEYKGSKLYVNGEYVEEPMIKATTHNFKLEEIGYKVIPDGYYFVLGDNRINSKDSRMIGLVPKDKIIGITDFCIFPLSKFGKLT